MKQVKLYFYTYKDDKPGIYYQNVVDYKQVLIKGHKTFLVKIVIDESNIQNLLEYLGYNHLQYALCKLKVLK